MERTYKVLTINCAQSVICKICTKQNQQMNKTMKEDGGNGNHLDHNFIVARHCLFQFFGWELFLKRHPKASSNAIRLVFFEMFRDWDRWILVVGSAASITSIEF